MRAPDIHYAKSGDVHIAYQVFGEGPVDLVLVPGFFTHVELIWEHEPAARTLRRLASFARVMYFDRRGSGLSDPVDSVPTLEERMDDVRAVMDAAGSERATLVGLSEGAAMSILFAAAHAERATSLVLYGGMARSTAAPDYPWAPPVDALIESNQELVAPYWGQGATVEVAAPSRAHDPDVRAFFAKMERASASPRMFGDLVRMFLDLDVREAARAVHVPTLILHRTHDQLVNVRNGRWLAENIPGARLVELPGHDHSFFYEGPDRVIEEIQHFVTGARAQPRGDRVLATVLFTDIVGSTRLATSVGDERWRDMLADHEATARATIRDIGGRTVKWTGDGVVASFDGPGRAVHCAHAIIERARSVGIEVRAGLHTGEVELLGDDIAGIAVHIAARVGALAGDGEVLVSRTVKDLMAGSAVAFSDRGTHELKGLPEPWALYAASGEPG
jgi:class 3 adenylate cyclase